ncbi:MAG: zinc-ribbon domain-containing protein, partial [Anaerolineae bacterium]
MICPQCGYENRPDARFCAQCGAPLTAGTVAWSPSPVEPSFSIPPPPPPPSPVIPAPGPVVVEK